MTKQTTQIPLKKLFNDALKKQDRIVHPNNKRKKRAKKNNQSGFFRVQKVKCGDCKQGFTWMYKVPTENGEHRISRTDILRLKKDIEDMGLKWSVVDEKKAMKTAKETKNKLTTLR